LPLAQLAGAARSARSLVLLGDQMQLPAPSEGHHPSNSGASCLEYVLGGAETVPPHLGVFLPTTYRLHPAICMLVSELSYRGLLRSHPSTAARTIQLGAAAPHADSAPARLSHGVGVHFVPVEHEGNTHAAPQEVSAIGTICRQLLEEATYVDGDEARRLHADDILVVAPYNLQVRALQAQLPPGVRVGTVDRFQGQEAPVVLLSLCHSDFQLAVAGASSMGLAETADGNGDGAESATGSDDPEASASGGSGSERGLSFVLNPNRLNVALSRAQCLAVVVGSPRLADTAPRTLRQQRELNVLCRIVEGDGAGLASARPS